MTEENKDNVVENEEEVNVDDLEPNADPKGGRLQFSKNSNPLGSKLAQGPVLTTPGFQTEIKDQFKK